MSDLDIRWKQRLSSYNKALVQLTKFIDKDELNELEEQGLIQAFEYTHELAWNLLKEFIKYQGNQEIYGSRDASREAFKLGLIENSEVWMTMIKDRNRTSHTYNRETAQAIATNIKKQFFARFIALQAKMQEISDADT